jgi:hypothetical protein
MQTRSPKMSETRDFLDKTDWECFIRGGKRRSWVLYGHSFMRPSQASQRPSLKLATRPESPLRIVALVRLFVVKSTLTELQAELEVYGACDPVKVEESHRAVVLGR